MFTHSHQSCPHSSSDLHGGGGQVGILMLELSVQGQPPLVPVVGQQWRQMKHLAEASLAGLNGEPLPETQPRLSGNGEHMMKMVEEEHVNAFKDAWSIQLIMILKECIDGNKNALSLPKSLSVKKNISKIPSLLLFYRSLDQTFLLCLLSTNGTLFLNQLTQSSCNL